MKKQPFIVSLLTAFMVLPLCLILLSSCDDTKKTNTSVGTFVCIKSFENVIRQEMFVFENNYPQTVLGCKYVTDEEAFRQIMTEETKLAITGRDLTEQERASLKKQTSTKSVRSQQVAVDAIALIVNPDNPVDTLSIREVARILKGELRTWAQIEPGAPNEPIRVVVDNPHSEIAAYMREKVLDGGSFDSSIVVTADSLSGVFDKVKYNKNYIGLIGSSWLTSDLGKIDETKLMEVLEKNRFDQSEINERMNHSGVKTVALMYNSMQAYRPTQENIFTGAYPLTRPIYAVTTALPASTLGKFYSYITGADGQKIMLSSGVMPARKPNQIYEIVQ